MGVRTSLGLGLPDKPCWNACESLLTSCPMERSPARAYRCQAAVAASQWNRQPEPKRRTGLLDQLGDQPATLVDLPLVACDLNHSVWVARVGVDILRAARTQHKHRSCLGRCTRRAVGDAMVCAVYLCNLDVGTGLLLQARYRLPHPSPAPRPCEFTRRDRDQRLI